MAVSKIKILCKEYSWRDITPKPEVHKVNFFSGLNPASTAPAIDLTDYLIQDGMGKIRYDFDTTARAGDGTNQLFFMASDITLALTNCVPVSEGTSLASFFKLNQDTSYIKFKVEIFYDNKLIYVGIIDQDGIDIPFGLSNDANVINCRVIGFEKEFVEYYKNDYLKANNLLPWGVHYAMPSITFEGPDEAVRPNTILLKNLIAQNMANPILLAENIKMEAGIADYEVVQTPFFFKASSEIDEIIWTKTSYERVENNNGGRETKWDWLRRLCNGMGWVIFFYYENEKFCMGIKNRSSILLPTLNLDTQSFIEYRVSKDKAQMTFDHMIIIDGTLIGGDNPAFYNNAHLKGEQLIIMSDFTRPNYHTSFIGNVTLGVHNYDLGFHNPYIHFYNEEGDNFRYSILENKEDTTPDVLTITKSNTLFVDAGDPGTEAQYFRTDNRRNGRGHTIGQTGSGDAHLVFKGCYANMLLKRIGNKWQSYHEYVKTNIFKNNFLKFRNTKQNKKFTGSYPEIILNPFQQFKLKNDPNYIIDPYDVYSIQSLTIDLVEEKTEMELYVSGVSL